MGKRLTAKAIEALENQASAFAETEESRRIAALKRELEGSFLQFSAHFFEWRTGTKMIIAPHHRIIASTIERVIAGEITRLIINIPPGYTKTELAVISLVAYGLALNPAAKFMHLSYSDNLALTNSATARAVVKSREYQSMWPMALSDDSDAKGLWINEQGGGLFATSSKGQVTGRRAGLLESGWTGALIIDDPTKPTSAESDVQREEVNTVFSNTIKSRLAHEDVPMIVIQQRVHHRDLTGHLLTGGSGEKWHHLNLPVIIDNAEPYPDEYTHGIPIAHGLADGWLWEAKHSEKHRVALMSHRRTFESQYMQAPRRFDAEGALWREELLQLARANRWGGRKTRTVVGVDPAVSNDASSDETGIVVASAYEGDRYSVDGDYSGKYTPDGWAKAAIRAYYDHEADAIIVERNQGGAMVEHTLRLAGFRGRIINVHASKGKFARAEPIAALYEQGKVSHAPSGLYKLESQMLEFVPADAKKSPDRMDAMVWALTDLAPLVTSQSTIFLKSR